MGAAVYAENIDNVQQQGLFAPLPQDTAIGATAYGKCDQVMIYDDGTRAVLVDRSASDTAPTIRVVTVANMSLITSAAPGAGSRASYDTLASDGESVHIGMGATSTAKPKWVGTVFHGQFGGAAPGTSILDAEVKRAESVGVWSAASNVTMRLPEFTVSSNLRTWDNSQVNFYIGQSYIYFASLVYDGHQEGPLHMVASLRLGRATANFDGSGAAGATVSSTASSESGVTEDYDGTGPTYSYLNAVTDTAPSLNDVAAEGLNRISFVLRARVASTPGNELLSSRVTGINIYRAAKTGSFSTLLSTYFGEDVEFPEPEFIRHIDINDSGWSAAAAGSGSEWFDLSTETYRSFTIVDDLPGGASTFESRSGYPATLEHMQLHYGVSCVASSYHIVGRAWHQDLEDVESWLFRSKQYRFDTFDWSQDYLVLPSEPNALVSWAGKVYAFCDGRTHVVNPTTFDVEDTWEGIGAPARKSVIVTDRGMFWADDNNIYFHDGNRVHMIGAPILKNQYSNDAAWLSKGAADPVLVYDSEYDSVIVCFTNASGNAAALSFALGSQAWSYITFAVPGPFYVGFQAADGKAYVSLDNTATPTFYSLFTNASLRAWKWVSPIIETIGAKARYYHVRLSYKANRPTVKFYDNDPTYTTAHTVSTWNAQEGNVDEGELTVSSGVWLNMREFALEIEGTATQDVTHIALIRRLVSAR